MSEEKSQDPGLRNKRAGQFILRLRKVIPFVTGVAAALAALVVYNQIFPPTPALTEKDVQRQVASVMASATPLPAYSTLVYQTIQPSIVLIQSDRIGDHGDSGKSLGTGVIVSDQGEILTSLHVVDRATEINLIFADGTHSKGKIISTQPENDIAVLGADPLPELLVPAILGNPNAMNIGDEAFVVGNPFGLYGSMSAGVISGFDRSFEAEGTNVRLEGLIQIDTAVNPGNSGGPLLNRSGHVIGIVVGILNPTDEEFFVGIGFAVPITVAGGAAGSPQY